MNPNKSRHWAASVQFGISLPFEDLTNTALIVAVWKFVMVIGSPNVFFNGFLQSMLFNVINVNLGHLPPAWIAFEVSWDADFRAITFDDEFMIMRYDGFWIGVSDLLHPSDEFLGEFITTEIYMIMRKQMN